MNLGVSSNGIGKYRAGIAGLTDVTNVKLRPFSTYYYGQANGIYYVQGDVIRPGIWGALYQCQ